MAIYYGTDLDEELNGNYEEVYGYGGNDDIANHIDGKTKVAGGSGNDRIYFDTQLSNTWGEASGDEGNDYISGGRGPNVSTLSGGEGDDIIGGQGTSLIDGGRGRDALHGSDEDDTISGGDGDESGDYVFFEEWNRTYEMPAGLFGQSGNDSLDGGSGRDLLDGGTDNDTLVGGADEDTLKGGADGDELTVGRSGNDFLDGGGGRDFLNGGSDNDTLVGGTHEDTLKGGTGYDQLTGGRGQDQLSGGQGRDVFVFDDKDTASSRTRADTISDFSGRSGDRLNLKLVDANSSRKGDQSFSFIGEAEGFTKAGQVRYEQEGKYTYVYLNTDADQTAEAVIKLKGSFDLQKGWFVL